MKKLIFICLTALFFSFSVFCQESSADLAESEDEFDSLFENVSDTQEAVVQETQQMAINAGSFSIPLNFSGNLSSDLGLGYIYNKNADDTKNGYFSFTNYLYMSAFPDKTLGIRGSIQTTFPSFSLSLHELYFDWLVFDRIYITAGKKSTTWGYVRLFTTDDDDDEYEYKKDFGFETNILSDSESGTTVMFRIPIWTGTVSALALYRGGSGTPGLRDMSFAGSFEFTVLKTSINFFGRLFPSASGSQKSENQGLKAGLELKRTVLDADFYVQGMAQFASNQKLIDIFSGDFSAQSFGDLVYTAGFYRWWDKFDPNIGFNIEFQDEFLPLSNRHERRIGFDGGLKRLGKNKNLKVGLEVFHSFTKDSGYVKPGFIISGALPHSDWNNGLKVEYKDGNLVNISIGSYLTLSLNY